MTINAPLRIGTRKSKLALIQTHLVCAALKKSVPALAEPDVIDVIELDTLGDQTQSQNLSLVEHGGKDLWVNEHEAAMRAGHVDCAVHSVKDIPGHLAEDMAISYVLPRVDARDVFLSPHADHFMDLPQGAVIGTSSPRRAAFVLSRRPDLKVEVFRGNVETRLKKLAEGLVDGTFLAKAGMVRLGFKDHIQTVLETQDMVPAVGQGAIGVEFLKERHDLQDLFVQIQHHHTGLSVTAERAWLQAMGGTCKSPLAAYAEFDQAHEVLTLTAFAARLDGCETKTQTSTAIVQTKAEAEKLGADLGVEMKASLPDDFFKAA